MIALVQLLIKYALLENYGVQTALDGLGICILILATLCIAAAGNIINDIYDITTDTINAPKKVRVGVSISEESAFNLFITLNILGVLLGFYVSNYIGKSAFFSVFIIISGLLYVYATYLKGIALIGNIVISVLVAASILIVGLFELTPKLSELNADIQMAFFKVILDYALFAFVINLMREITKDIEDVEGDKQTGLKTLPILVGTKRSKISVLVLNFVVIGCIVNYAVKHLYKLQFSLAYFLVLIVGPLIYISLKLLQAESKEDFHHISSLYKMVMLFGMLSLLLYKFII